MRYLLDTGIIVRFLHRSDPLHNDIRITLRTLKDKGHTFVTARQNIVEFWNVCTRPLSARGGYGLALDETSQRLRIIERLIDVLAEPHSVYVHWKRLVGSHGVTGRQVHDARIVAVMAAYRIKHILTLNPSDFARYPSIHSVTPASVLTA